MRRSRPERCSVSATGVPDGAPDYHPDYVLLGSDGTGVRPLGTLGPTGTTPAQIRHAYGFDQISFSGGTVAADGSGTTIAIVDAYDDPNIASDLHQFDVAFGLADPPVFTKVNQTGGTSYPARQRAAGPVKSPWMSSGPTPSLPGPRSCWSRRTTVTRTRPDAPRSHYAAAQPGVVAVSMSWGGGEFPARAGYDSYFTTPTGHAGVTFVASSGDSGAPPSLSGELAQRAGGRRHDV